MASPGSQEGKTWSPPPVIPQGHSLDATTAAHQHDEMFCVPAGEEEGTEGRSRGQTEPPTQHEGKVNSAVAAAAAAATQNLRQLKEGLLSCL